ncbi:terminase large subunit [Corynebacterium camporealensis]|uniref:terminase large subunit domain-containing protein n=1 Tax=Corynebacterium camporealensis TaxID=161896 RepID=UPI0034CE6BA8
MCRPLFEGTAHINVWVLPRGNGKSGLVAAIALHHLFTFGEGARVMVVAQNDKAAQRLLDTAKRMVALEPELDERAQVYKDRIYVPGTDSEFKAVASEQSAVEGEDLTLAIIDEIGFTDVDVYEAALLSTGKRPGSKLVAIGTPSTPRMRDKSPLLGLVTAGRAGDPTINLVEYSAPDNCAVDDEEALAAANPALGDWLDLDVIRASMPPKTSEAEYRRARLGQWVLQSGESFMPPDAWGECARPGVAIPEGTPVVLALDGSQRWDATVLMMASVSPVPHVEVAGWWFGDHDPDFEVSHAEVENTILDFAERFKVREVTADPYLWQRTLQVLQEEGLPVSKFSQSAGRMSPALAEFRAAALDGKVTHQDDHRVNAHMLAAQLIESGHGMKLGKPSKEMHIDGAVATVMAYSRAFWLGSKRLKKKNKSYRR